MTRSIGARLRAQPGARAAMVCVLVFVFTATFGSFAASLVDAPLALEPLHEFEGPSATAWLGRAENGVSLGWALVVGARTSLLIALLTTAVSLSVGVGVGCATALVGGRVDALLLRGLDVLSSFPGILLAIYLAAVLPPSSFTVVAALSATGWVAFARVTRTSVASVLAREHVVAARAIGVPPATLVIRHVLPIALAPVVVQASFSLSGALLAEASLAFLGLGAPPGTPSWGALLDEGVTYLFAAPHLAIVPGACIVATVLSFQVLGDALLAALDVRSRARHP